MRTMNRSILWSGLTSWLVLARVSSASPASAPSPPASAQSDSLRALLGRWTAAVGGTPALAKIHGMHLRARAILGGVPSTTEVWITRAGMREVTVQDSGRAELVRHGSQVWIHDWNGKTRALQGRDRKDAVSDAFLRALAFMGPARDALSRAGAREAGMDSTGTLRVVRLAAPDSGVACDLFLDPASGRPVRTARKPYDDPVVTEFRDWRKAGGVSIPFTILDIDREGNVDTTWVQSAEPIAAAAAPKFARPADGASDVRFASGDRALGIPFNFDNDHIMVECSVNGTQPLWFLVDTGADYNVLNEPRLAEMKLTRFGASSTSGGGGSTGLTFSRVARLEVGHGVTLLGQRGGVVDLSGLEKLYGMPMGGLLGMDFIDRFTMVVDYDHHVLNLYTPGRDAGIAQGTCVPFIVEEGHPHAAGAVVVDDAGEIPADFIIDSGAAESANLTMPFVRDHRLLERARRTPAPAASITPGTEHQWYTQTTVRGFLRSLRLGGVTVHDLPVNLQQGTTGAYSSPSFSGTVGERLLSRFNATYDYTHSALYLAPNAASAKPFPPRTTFGVSLMADGDDYTHFSVAGVRKGSPADSAGFLKGDVIATLDGKPASAWRLATVRTALADEGSRHRAEIQRGAGGTVPIEFTVHLVSIEDH